MSNNKFESDVELARNAAPEQVAFYMSSAEKYIEEFGIEEMDRTQFLGVFAQACVANANATVIAAQLEAIRAELRNIAHMIQGN